MKTILPPPPLNPYGLFSGFMPGNPAGVGGPSIPILTRGLPASPDASQFFQRLQEIQRGDGSYDLNALLAQFGQEWADFQRAITSTTSNLPIRENLEAEAKVLVPLDTPVRNRLPRRPGAGLAAAWRQVTSLGAGHSLSTTVTSGAASATQTVGSTLNMRAGDTLYFATTAATRIVASITDATTVVLTATITTTTSEVVTRVGMQGPAAAPIRAFFAETGAPADHATAYAAKSASYKLMGTYFSVTGLAMAAGANFQDQYAMERGNAIRNLMLNEEYALINGDSAAVGAPWGDGSTALAFAGLINLITTANGTPADQVQTAVGALTTAHIDAQLGRLYNQGARGFWMIMNEQEARSLAHLAEASGSILRIVQEADNLTMGKRVTGYLHPITGEKCDIVVDRFIAPGTILFMSDFLPDGTPTADVEVLPQVSLPQLAPNESVQGYTAQELAPSLTAPQVYPGIVSVYEVLRLKSALHVAKSTGITAV